MWRKRRVCTGQEGWTGVGEKGKYFLVKEKAVPEILLKVVEAKKLLDSERVITVQEAAERVGISRSSFTSTRMTFFHSMTIPRERQLRLSCRWMTSRGFCRTCCGLWQCTRPTS